LIAPPGATSLTWPALPSALAAHEPTASDEVTVRVNLLDFGAVDDYAAVRALPEPEVRFPNVADTGATRDYALSFGSN